MEDTAAHRIVERLSAAFFSHFRYRPPDSELRAWQNSLEAMSRVMREASLTDHGVLLEYQLPLASRRLDCILAGRDRDGRSSAVVVELKQWERVLPSAIDDCVTVWVGGRDRDVLHPSRQVGQYHQYLEDCHSAFAPGGVTLASCAYLHNLQHDPTEELYHPRHAEALRVYPLFAANQADELTAYLTRRLEQGRGMPVLTTILESKYQPSKTLLAHTAAMIKGQKVFVPLDEQLIVFNTVLAEVANAIDAGTKSVVLVRGGPGTGKSVIALNLVGVLSGRGFATPRDWLQSVHWKHQKGCRSPSRSPVQVLQYAAAPTDVVDALILDEAHRLRPFSHNRFTGASRRSGTSQIRELINAARVSVFFIDDLQIVRPGEVGSSDLIRDTAEEMQLPLREFELEAQFRCNGSDAFINWVDNALQIQRTANVMWDSRDAFEFRIVDSVDDLERQMRKRHDDGFTARLTAGFCWPWSDPTPGGQLRKDVKIGSWTMPWNAKPDAGRLASGIPKAIYWASDARGIDQVGCVYTAQGFEFDHCGVIFGRDLRFDSFTGRWVGDRSASRDPIVSRSGDAFLDLVKNTYRVLLTRGVKGCYVFFEDLETKAFFRSRIE